MGLAGWRGIVRPFDAASQTEGVYGTSGTVQDYLDHQQLAPFFAMSERYGKLYQRMVEMSAVWQRVLSKTLSRRTALGLKGIWRVSE